MAGSVGDGEFGFQIAPMLDILFVLLLFFMVSAGAQKHEASITTQLPGRGTGPADQAILKVGIDDEGQININQSDVDTPKDHKLPGLVARLSKAIQQNPDQSVIITPDRTAKQQRVIDVLNACAVAKVKNLAFGESED